MEENLRFQIDWANLIVGIKFAILERNFPSTPSRGFMFRGAIYRRVTALGGLYSEGLIHGGSYFRNFTVVPFRKVGVTVNLVPVGVRLRWPNGCRLKRSSPSSEAGQSLRCYFLLVVLEARHLPFSGKSAPFYIKPLERLTGRLKRINSAVRSVF